MSFFRLSVACIALIQLSCYLEEWIFKALPGFHYHWTVALVELLFFTVAGWCGARRKRAAPLTVYAGIGCSLAAGTGLGKLAYRYLNFESAHADLDAGFSLLLRFRAFHNFHQGTAAHAPLR